MARNDDNRKGGGGSLVLISMHGDPGSSFWPLHCLTNNGLEMGGKLQTELGQLTGTKDMVRC